MIDQIVKDGSGILQGLSNNSSQPGKKITLLDGDIVLVHLLLDKEFPDVKVSVNGKDILVGFGATLDVAFSTNLRAQTDGIVNIYWR